MLGLKLGDLLRQPANGVVVDQSHRAHHKGFGWRRPPTGSWNASLASPIVAEGECYYDSPGQVLAADIPD